VLSWATKSFESHDNATVRLPLMLWHASHALGEAVGTLMSGGTTQGIIEGRIDRRNDVISDMASVAKQRGCSSGLRRLCLAPLQIRVRDT
jgi:hypothetical protein